MSKWLKDPKYKMLYSLNVSIKSAREFQKLIGFRHPMKSEKLKAIASNDNTVN